MKTINKLFLTGVLSIFLTLGATGCYTQPGFRYSEHAGQNDDRSDRDPLETEYEYDDYGPYNDDPVNVYHFYGIEPPACTHVWWYGPYYQLNHYGWGRLHRRWGWSWTVRVNCRRFNVFRTWAPPVYYTDPYVYVIYANPRPWYRPHYYSSRHYFHTHWYHHHYYHHHYGSHRPRADHMYTYRDGNRTEYKQRQFRRRYPVQNSPGRHRGYSEPERRPYDNTRQVVSASQRNRRRMDQNQQSVYTSHRKATDSRTRTGTPTYDRSRRVAHRQPAKNYSRQNRQPGDQKRTASVPRTNKYNARQSQSSHRSTQVKDRTGHTRSSLSRERTRKSAPLRSKSYTTGKSRHSAQIKRNTTRTKKPALRSKKSNQGRRRSTPRVTKKSRSASRSGSVVKSRKSRSAPNSARTTSGRKRSTRSRKSR